MFLGDIIMGHMKHKSCAMILLGLILIGNEYYFRINWWYLFGALLIINGVKHMFLCKGHDGECCTQPEKKEHKKKK